jgi:RHS repeat-associated protein
MRRTALLPVVSLVAGLLVATTIALPSEASAAPPEQPAGWTTTLAISPGAVTSPIGSGTDGLTDGTGTGAALSNPRGMAIVGGAGYFFDGGYIRKVTLSTLAVTTVAGSGANNCANSANPVLAGVGTPADETMASDGTNLYWSDLSCDSGDLRKMSLSTGAVDRLPGPLHASAVTIGPSGTLYAASGAVIFSADPTTGATSTLATLPNISIGAGSYTPQVQGMAADGSYLWISSTVYDGTNHHPYLQSIDLTSSTVVSYPVAFSGQIVSAGSYLYLTANLRLVRITKADQTFADVAGASSTTGGYLDGIGPLAWFRGITGLDTDGTNLWVSDPANHRIRQIAAGSALTDAQPSSWTSTIDMGLATVSTTAGSGTSAVTDGTGTAAAFTNPIGMTIVNGNGYTIDSGYVRKINLTTNVVTTVSGDGSGSCLDSATPTSARIGQTWASQSAVSDGSFLYWADGTCGLGSGAGILRRMSLTTGAVSTLPGPVYAQALTIGPSGVLYGGNGTQIFAVDIVTGETALVTTLPSVVYSSLVYSQSVWSMTADATHLWVIGKYSAPVGGGSSGDRSTMDDINFSTGTATLNFQQDDFNDPTTSIQGAVVSAGIYLYVSALNGYIFRVAKAGGTFGRVAGNGAGYSDGSGAAALFRSPSGIDTDGTNLWVADAGNYRIRKLGVAVPVRSLPSSATATFPTLGIDKAELPGGSNASERCACGSGQSADPVNTATGAYWEGFTDLALPGRGPALSLSRTYVSYLAAQDGLFGHGWSCSYCLFLTNDPANGDITVHQEDGSQIAFAPTTGLGLTPVQPRELATLTNNSNGSYTLVRGKRISYTFNATGHLTGISDLNGYSTTISYDTSGNIAAVTDPAGRAYTITTTGGRITQVTDPASRSYLYTYSSAGDLTSVTDPTAAVTTFTYDSNHRLLTMLDPRQQGVSSPVPLTNVYDTSGRVTSQSDFLGRTTYFDYTSITGATKITDPAGHVTVDYYTNGQRTSSVAGYGTADAATTVYTYDSTTAAIASVEDARNHTTSYTYDASGNMLTATDPLGRTTTNTYDSLNDPLTSRDGTNVTTTNTYDTAGNLLTTSRPLLSHTGTTLDTRSTTYSYGDSSHPGDITAVLSPNGNTTHNVYDSYGDLISVTAPPTPENSSGDKTTYTYDTTTGRRTSMVSPKGNVTGGTPANYTTSYAYDDDGRLTSSRDPLWSAGSPTLHQATATYDADGNVHTSTDGNNATTTYTYDAANELITTTRPDTTAITQAWTADGLLHTRTDAASHTTTYSYDNRNNLVTSQDPLSHTTTYTYDLTGNLTLQAAPGASCGTTPTTGCTSFSYDDADQLTARSYLDGVTHNITSISYDDDGRRTGMTDATGTSTWVYDSLGRLTSTTDGNSVTTSYGHDLDGNTTTISYPGTGHTVTRAFDALDRLSTVTDWNGNTVTAGYDENSNPTTNAFPSGTAETDTTAYDAADQVTGITDTKLVSGSPTTLAGFSYTRDGSGQLLTSATTGISEPNQTYSYNSLEQLTATGSSTTPTTFSYNAGNDVTNRGTTSGGSASTLAYNAGDELCWSSPTTVTGPTCGTVPTGATSYTYDVNGNRTGTTTATSSQGYSYDEAQNMATSTNPAGSVTSYTYDADGLRQSKTTGGTTTHFTWDHDSGGLPLLLADDTNYYVYGIDDQPLEQLNASTGTVTWLHPDQVGSTRLLTDTTGATVGTYSYDAYGAQTAHTGTVGSALGYNGQYTDTETGLIYLRARYYDPVTAQFTTVDPALAATGAPYGYAADNPLSFSDPSGLSKHSLWGAIGSGVLSGLEGAANGLTGGGVAKIDEAISPGSTCTYAHNGIYNTLYAGTLIASVVYTGGVSAEARVAEITADSEGGFFSSRLAEIRADPERGSIGFGSPKANQMNRAIQRGQAPRGIVRIDLPKIPFEKLHATFKDGSALNVDGTWKHGGIDLTRDQAAWLEQNGWTLP